jgi:hypothetical protein
LDRFKDLRLLACFWAGGDLFTPLTIRSHAIRNSL